MRKVEILSKAVDIESTLVRTDIKILSIDIKSVEQSSSFQEGICAVVCYEDDLSVVEPEPDWIQIRIQASIAAMQGMLANHEIVRFYDDCALVVIAKSSVAQADSLITELKKKTK